MRYLVLLLFLTINCQKVKPLTYEEGLKKCSQMQEEKRKEHPDEYSFVTADCMTGVQIPDFEAITIDGAKINRASLKGKPTIINFWFTTCAPCVAEIPGLNAVVDKFGADHINCIAIGREDSSDIKEFLITNPWKFQQIANGEELTQDVFKMSWGFPTTLLLNKNAEIIAAFSGGSADFSSMNEVEQKLIPIIERELD